MSSIQDDEPFEVYDAFTKEHSLVEHQIVSFNDFASNGVRQIIERDPVIEHEGYVIRFTGTYSDTPTHKEANDTVRRILPAEAKRRGIAYSAKTYFTVEMKTPVKTPEGEFIRHDLKVYPSVHFGGYNVMVGSAMCNRTPHKHDWEFLAKNLEDIYDEGGYFITKGGGEKVISSQQQTAPNQIHVFNKRTRIPKFDTYSEVRSTDTSYRNNATYIGVKKGLISVTIPYIDGIGIPITILFAALGCKDVTEMFSYISQDTSLLIFLTVSIEKNYPFCSQNAALRYIGTCGKKFNKKNKTQETDETVIQKESYAKHLLTNEFLPHIGKGESCFTQKLRYVGLMVRRLLEVLAGKRKVTDRDSYEIKVIARIGDMFGQVFNSGYKKLRKYIVDQIDKRVKQNDAVNILSIIKPSIIQTIMSNAITSNMWNGKKKTPGISQAYERFNYAATIANSRKLFTTINPKGGKIEGARIFHPSHPFRVCPAETPEGKKCGLIVPMAATCWLSSGENSNDVGDLLRFVVEKHSLPVTFGEDSCRYTGVQINGTPVGYTDDATKVANVFRSYRRRCQMNFETHICHDTTNNVLSIRTDGGRIMRPLLVVEDGKLVLTKKHLDYVSGDIDGMSKWHYLLNEGVVEIIDSKEESETNVIMYPSDLDSKSDYEKKIITHCEIHPSLMYGIGAARIVFANHNQSPRNAYHAAMIKQAVGIPSLVWRHNIKNKLFVLDYPQRSIVTTRITRTLDLEKLPCVQNVYIAVCPWEGFGQEDSILICEDAVKRGLFATTVLIPYMRKIKREKDELIEVPKPEECDNFKGNASKLNPLTGYVKIGEKVFKGDILIGATSLIHQKTTAKQKNQTQHQSRRKHSISLLYDQTVPGIVHNIECGIDGEGYEYVCVVIAQQRTPELGDKFSTGAGQKGVCGMFFKAIDGPRNQYGIVPDVIMNPLAFPSRMTIGVMIEILSGKQICSTHALHTIPMNKAFRGDDAFWEDPKGENNPIPKVDYTGIRDMIDGTPYQKDASYLDICAELRKLGINEFGEEYLYNGITGEELPNPIFTGIVAHMRLKHMVVDKYHARSVGGRTRITHQPKEGRKAGGGFRYGVMERDVINAAGATFITRDRLLEQSDITTMCFCKLCGLPAIAHDAIPETKTPPSQECRVCESNNVGFVAFSYATKLIIQEFIGMCVVIRVLLTPHTQEVKICAGERIIGKGMWV